MRSPQWRKPRDPARQAVVGRRLARIGDASTEHGILGLVPKASIVQMQVVEVDIADIAGSLGAGKPEDIIAVDGDPLANVTELQRLTRWHRAYKARSKA